MSVAVLFSEPDFKSLVVSPKVDFVRFFSPTPAATALLVSGHRHVKHLRAEGHNGILLTIHDPEPSDLAVIAAGLPDAMWDSLEVSLDFRPRRAIPHALRAKLLEETRQWLLSCALPWEGPGIQRAARASGAPGQVTAVFNGDTMRRPGKNETLYFGHSNSVYADNQEPNFAFMRLYRKVKDNSVLLPPHKHAVRFEVNLNRDGCRHFGLSEPKDLLDFRFRRLGPYFRLVRPHIKRPVFPATKRANPKMAALMEDARLRCSLLTATEAGAHALATDRLAILDRLHRHPFNRQTQMRLDNLTKKFSGYRTKPAPLLAA